jgi:deoxyribodipyrimidine photo-lyase
MVRTINGPERDRVSDHPNVILRSSGGCGSGTGDGGAGLGGPGLGSTGGGPGLGGVGCGTSGARDSLKVCWKVAIFLLRNSLWCWTYVKLKSGSAGRIHLAQHGGQCNLPTMGAGCCCGENRAQWTGPGRQEFLCGCLDSLAKNLAQIGGRLILRSGSPTNELIKLALESHAQAIYFNRNYSPYDVRIEQQIQESAGSVGLEIRTFKDTVIMAPDEILNQRREPFRVFTPYARAWHQRQKPKPLPQVRNLKTPCSVPSEPIPTLEHWCLSPGAKIIEPGERAARNRLRTFLKGPIFKYATRRNQPGAHGTSRLSQDLRFGTISPREVYAACQQAALDCTAAERREINAYVNEIVWREFNFQILWHFPHVLDEDFDRRFSAVRWDDDQDKFRRWREGTTGFPIVDAGMRELNATGFMQNRVRMIVAMFLTKDLHLHWREGETYFIQKLVDGDIRANNGGWQWSSGTGADAAHYFRIQNPWTQTKTYDPQGEYIKRWVPELKDVDPARFTVPPSERLAASYPLPVVDHAKEREIAFERFHNAQNSRGMSPGWPPWRWNKITSGIGFLFRRRSQQIEDEHERDSLTSEFALI